MIIEINEIQYKVKTEWEDITLNLAQQLTSIEKPKKLLAVYNAKEQETFDAAVKDLKRSDCIDYYKEVIVLLSDVPKDVMESTDKGITDFYFQYVEKLIVDMHNMYPFSYKHRDIKSFKFKGQTYMIPVEETLLNDTKPLANETTQAFIEGMELRTAIQNKVMAAEGIAGITAVFARPKGVDFDEKGAIKRAQLFNELTMDNHWEVFFCLMLLLKRSAEITSTFLEDQAKAPSN